MSSTRATRTVVVNLPEGLHARPAELLARTAMKFQSHVELVNGSLRVDAKSILHLLTLGASQGTELIIEATGEDAAAAAEAVERLMASDFTTDDTIHTEQAASSE